MTVKITIPAGDHRHRLDAAHPERTPFADLARRLRVEVPPLPDMPPVGHDTVVMDALTDPDAALARATLEQHNSAWLAPERAAHCGGQVEVMGHTYRCPEHGAWGVTGRRPRFCPIHAVEQVRVVDAMRRAAEKAGA